MGLESVNHISDLDSKNPLAGDNVSQGDDHIRNIKTALLADFPNINATVSATPTQLDYTAVTTLGTAEPSKALTASIASTITFNGMTVTDLGTVTTADINGGTLDGVAIGNSSRSSIKATTLNASQSLVLATGSTVTGISNDDGMAADSAVLIPTQAAAKGYTDAAIAATATVQSSTSSSAGHLELLVSAGVGIMVTWGTHSAGGGGGTVTFEKAFSATPWSVVVGAQDNAGGSSTAAASHDTVNESQFTYGANASTDSITYIAIGPTTI